MNLNHLDYEQLTLLEDKIETEIDALSIIKERYEDMLGETLFSTYNLDLKFDELEGYLRLRLNNVKEAQRQVQENSDNNYEINKDLENSQI